MDPAALSPDGRFSTVRRRDGIGVVDCETGEELTWLPTPGWEVEFALFNWNRSKVALLAPEYGRVEVWDIPSAKLSFKAELPKYNVHNVLAYSASDRLLQFSRDGTRLAAASGNIRKVWDLGTGRELFSTTPESPEARLSPDGRLVLYLLENRLEIVHTHSGQRTSFPLPEGDWAQPVWSRDQTRALLLGAPKSTTNSAARIGTWICDLTRGESHMLSPAPSVGSYPIDELHGDWSPDGKRLATIGKDFRVTLWDGDGRYPILTLNTEAANLRFSEEANTSPWPVPEA